MYKTNLKVWHEIIIFKSGLKIFKLWLTNIKNFTKIYVLKDWKTSVYKGFMLQGVPIKMGIQRQLKTRLWFLIVDKCGFPSLAVSLTINILSLPFCQFVSKKRQNCWTD